jgi:26S proteasome regulatory subunit N12
MHNKYLFIIIIIFFLLQRDWNLKAGDYYAFQIDVKKSDDSLSALDLAKQAVEYARELEMIV